MQMLLVDNTILLSDGNWSVWCIFLDFCHWWWCLMIENIAMYMQRNETKLKNTVNVECNLLCELCTGKCIQHFNSFSNSGDNVTFARVQLLNYLDRTNCPWLKNLAINICRLLQLFCTTVHMEFSLSISTVLCFGLESAFWLLLPDDFDDDFAAAVTAPPVRRFCFSAAGFFAASIGWISAHCANSTI